MKTNKHFEFTGETKVNELGITMHQIRATKDTKYAKNGDIGGWIEKEENLHGNARVSDYARVFGNARVFGDAWVAGDARVFGNARVFGDAWVSGNVRVSGDARVKSNYDHCGFDLFGSANRHTHAYKTADGEIQVTCGCFIGSLEEFHKKVEKTHAGTIYEKQYKMIIELIKLKLAV